MAPAIQVLLVEDNPGDAMLLQRSLNSRAQDFEVAWVDRLVPALERVAAGKFDIVLLDLQLPDSNGLMTFVQMFAAAPALPILILSGLGDEEVGLQAVRTGAEDYLIKGRINPGALARAIRYAIERHRFRETIRTQSLVDDLT